MSMLTALALALPFVPLGSQEPVPVESRVSEVTVYGGSASVRRSALLPPAPAGSGLYVLRGLPAGLDPNSVRVRLSAGEVVGVEVRPRFQPNVPDERVQDLRTRIQALVRELALLDDEAEVAKAMLEHVQRLLRQEEGVHAGEVQQGRVNAEAWEANFRYLGGKLEELKKVQRDIALRREAKTQALNDLRLELGQFESAGGVQLADVIVDAVGGGGTLELEYVVANAGWEPYYDLRAKKDLAKVELAYRAKVYQQTGEDWVDAEVLLSTAQPQRGAQGPEAQPVWLSLLDPNAEVPQRKGIRRNDLQALEGIGYSAGDAPAAAPATVFAAVESEGLSVRFRLPRKETIESRPEPTTVLVGRADLALVPEHYVVPALDPTVWLRAEAKNTSEWVLLPGPAAVYFGADFVGHAHFDAVQLGQPFTLHLGADPGLVVTRTQIEDLREGPGVFGSKATKREAWRIEVENHGAFTPRADGAVQVIVQEALPRARDDRIEVAIAKVEPKLADDARWRKEREEKGLLTWLLTVPKAGQARIELVTEIEFPEDQKLVRH